MGKYKLPYALTVSSHNVLAFLFLFFFLMVALIFPTIIGKTQVNI